MKYVILFTHLGNANDALCLNSFKGLIEINNSQEIWESQSPTLPLEHITPCLCKASEKSWVSHLIFNSLFMSDPMGKAPEGTEASTSDLVGKSSSESRSALHKASGALWPQTPFSRSSEFHQVAPRCPKLHAVVNGNTRLPEHQGPPHSSCPSLTLWAQPWGLLLGCRWNWRQDCLRDPGWAWMWGLCWHGAEREAWLPLLLCSSGDELSS